MKGVFDFKSNAQLIDLLILTSSKEYVSYISDVIKFTQGDTVIDRCSEASNTRVKRCYNEYSQKGLRFSQFAGC